MLFWKLSLLKFFILKRHFAFIQPQLMESVCLFLFLPVKSLICELLNTYRNTFILVFLFYFIISGSQHHHLCVEASIDSQVRFLTQPWIFLLPMELSSRGSFQFSQIYSLLINSEIQSTEAFYFHMQKGTLSSLFILENEQFWKKRTQAAKNNLYKICIESGEGRKSIEFL